MHSGKLLSKLGGYFRHGHGASLVYVRIVRVIPPGLGPQARPSVLTVGALSTPLLLTGVLLHPPGRTDKNLCRCFGAPATHARRPHGRVFSDHLIT